MRSFFAAVRHEPDDTIALPEWITPEEFAYYVAEFGRTGFTGALNWYRNYDRNWESTPQLATAQITAPALFIGGTADPVRIHHAPGTGPRSRQRTVSRGMDLRRAATGCNRSGPTEVNRILLAFLATSRTQASRTEAVSHVGGLARCQPTDPVGDGRGIEDPPHHRLRFGEV